MSKALAVSKVIWIVLCLLDFAVCVSFYNSTTNRDNDIVLYLTMIALAFPSAYIVVLLYSGSQALHVPPLPLGRTEMSVLWAAFAVVGYLQWFVILPWVIKKVRHVCGMSHSNSSSLRP